MLKRRHYPQKDRAIFQILRACKGLSAKEAVEGTPVAPATFAAMRSSKTRYPRHITLSELARARGLEWALVPTATTRRGKEDETHDSIN